MTVGRIVKDVEIGCWKHLDDSLDGLSLLVKC